MSLPCSKASIFKRHKNHVKKNMVGKKEKIKFPENRDWDKSGKFPGLPFLCRLFLTLPSHLPPDSIGAHGNIDVKAVFIA